MHASHDARPAATDALRPLRYLLRLPLLCLHLALGLPLVIVMVNPLTRRWAIDGETVDHRMIRWWSRTMLRIFGLRVRRHGVPLAGGALFVANHVSWIDITLLHSQKVVGFVAKAEIGRWPFIGWLALRADTIYHQRGSHDSLHGVMHLMFERLAEGRAVGVFPEGRTTPGDSVHVFHARIFQPAVLAAVPAQPVALRYGAEGEAQRVVAFGPGESFLGNFWRLLGEPAREAGVHFLEPVAPSEDGRRRMAEACRARIAAVMGGATGGSAPEGAAAPAADADASADA